MRRLGNRVIYPTITMSCESSSPSFRIGLFYLLMENKILEIIQHLNQERLKAEEKGKVERAEKLLTASQVLKEIYL